MTDYKTLYVVKEMFVFYWEYLLNCLTVDKSIVKSKATRIVRLHTFVWGLTYDCYMWVKHRTQGIRLMCSYNVRVSEILRARGEMEAQALYFEKNPRTQELCDCFDHLTHNHIKFPVWPVAPVTCMVNVTMYSGSELQSWQENTSRYLN